MIAFLSGTVAEKGANRVVLETGGVGYDLTVPTSTVAKLPAIGRAATVHTRMVVRDDGITLYGFSSPDERSLFDLLTGVNGVGPKVALAFLSGLRPDALRRAVLAVSGPTGLVLDKEFAAGITPSFSAAGEGGPTPDGRYNYALRIRQATGRVVRDSQDPSRTAREERTITRRGSFRVRGGAIVLDDDAARSGDEAAR